MKLLEHYIRLLNEINKVETPILTTMEELSATLFCSKRYTKQIIKELKEKGWITWEVRPGRGNRSILTLLWKTEDIELIKAQELFQQGKYKQSLKPMQQLSHGKREEFLKSLEGQLGYDSKENRDILRYPFYEAVKNLDPYQLVSRHDVHIAEQIYNTLVTFNASGGEFEPQLAYAWEVDDSGLKWTFYLRKGVCFHHGKKLDADDVVFTFERLLHLQGEKAAWIKGLVEAVMKVNTYSVQFRLKKANYLFLNYLSSIRAAIIPEDSKTNLGERPIGTGPFKLHHHDESMMVLEAHEQYFQGRPFLNRVEIIHLPELYPKQTQLSFWKNNNDKQIETSIRKLEKGATYLSFNLRKNWPLKDEKLRQSIMEILDAGELTSYLGVENNAQATSFMPEKSAVIRQKEERITTINLSNTLVICGTEIRKGANVERELKWVAEKLIKEGYNVRSEIVPIDKLAKDEFLSRVDMVIGGIAFSEDDVLSYVRFFQIPHAFIYNLAEENLQHKIDQTIQKVENTSDRSKQLRLLLELEETIINRKLIHLFYHRAQQVNIYHSSIQGVSLMNNGRVMYKDLWFKK
ncbi:ABC transporter substrate-binding protein [Sutcliffiella rhizosphaerae]|uniref:HTH-type transcriptional regulator SgrR n=1 Tax=Sutcliffiella rhizosphaerae TaxID=2880967 RepID=A0ABN8A5L9_9BACI|nr:ABC transporter substrate-binding protein [Sutcliffiella rhizosphaerae]CAG9620401.1 HTH-type transcriptional regulator SgrR [Sutcliffiella rhizosphaerae]